MLALIADICGWLAILTGIGVGLYQALELNNYSAGSFFILLSILNLLLVTMPRR